MNYRYLIVLAAVLLGLPEAPEAAQDKFKLKPGGGGKVCMTCHVAFQDKLALPFVHTPVKRGECSGCHNPHTSGHAKLLDEGADRMCLRCHPTLIPGKAGSVHAPASAGKCMSCHDPHGAKNRANTVEAGNKLCFTCHAGIAERSARSRFKHRPAEEGCLTCHSPHASAGAKMLLKDPVPALCVKCHRTDRPLFAKQHMNYPVAESACTSCHNAHGSDRAGILYDTVHKPVASKMCSQCHEEPTSPNALSLRKSGFELCRSCHSGMVKDAFEKNYLHWPVAGKKGCQSCHAPHASPYKGLLAAPVSAVCGSCHADTMERQRRAKSPHRPVKDGDCSACHQPHGSDNAVLLTKAAMPDLCGTCHDWQKHSSHPIETVKDPRDRNLAVSCGSCHRTHGTDHKRMLPHATVTELCVQCHEQYRR